MTRQELEETHVAIPKWFVKGVTAGIGLMLTVTIAAVPWAMAMSNSISIISVQLASKNELHDANFTELRSRQERLEQRMDRLDERLRSAGE